ncbi:hypothetical protein BDW42DRAFT_193165 [Aspergillus taichungensis]|uniref:Octanoyltransferase n=1 Tax=Aspergillus taichungensis TaxID=482145 RepID=A0A2J5HXF7_9EURO|nr:hypothetical protein BDW42DRAFT_193165 [Aspergillus taichungensis]
MRLAHLHLPDITSFTRVSNLQQTLTSRLLAHKKLTDANNASSHAPPDPTIITFTPNPVYTTGRRDLPPSNTSNGSGNGSSSSSSTLSLPPALEPIRPILTGPTKRAEYHPTLRGGQTTYHGPGQMVAYTILDLRRLGLTPRCHIRALENSVVDVLARYNLQGLITSDPGVWVRSKDDDGPAKKITAVGVHLRRNISSYGIGFNVTEEPMWYFRQIVPCGLEGREATSLEGEGVGGVSVGEVAEGFVGAFVERVNRDFACSGGKGTGEKIEGVYSVSEGDLV